MVNSAAPDDDDDEELELEPLDPEVVAHQRSRHEQKAEQVVARVSADELFPERKYSDLEVDLSGLKNFQFTTRHLLGLTALAAIVLSLYLRIQGCSTAFVLMVVAVVAGWIYVYFQDRRQEAERERQRAEYLARMASPAPAQATVLSGTEAISIAAEPISTEADAAPLRRIDLDFAFSMKEVLLTMTVAAVAMALVRWQGVERMSVALGVVALGGLIVQAGGWAVPRLLSLGWFLLMVMYLAVGLFAASQAG